LAVDAKNNQLGGGGRGGQCRSWGATLVEVLKVSSKSNPNSVAGALAGVVRGSGQVEIQVVGAGALNQAIKAVAIARGYVASSGLDLTCRPTFADIEIDGEGRTAIRLLIEACEPKPVGAWAPQAAASMPVAAEP
jgi:stage V sporulation protein S